MLTFYHEFRLYSDDPYVYNITINTTSIKEHLNMQEWDGFDIIVSRGPGGYGAEPTSYFLLNSSGAYGLNITYAVDQNFVDPGYPFPYNLTYEIERVV
jgi:hypothetical protein